MFNQQVFLGLKRAHRNLNVFTVFLPVQLGSKGLKRQLFGFESGPHFLGGITIGITGTQNPLPKNVWDLKKPHRMGSLKLKKSSKGLFKVQKRSIEQGQRLTVVYQGSLELTRGQ